MLTKGHKAALLSVLWGASVLLVFVIGMICFPREYGLNIIESFYYTLRLFILEHDLPSFPKSPPLIFIHFFAPLVAISALWSALTYLFRFSPALKTRFLSGHVVVCGVGRTGKLMAETFGMRGIPVVGVDVAKPNLMEEWSDTHRVPMICGDFLSQETLERAGASRARAVVFASGDDLLNLEGVVSAYGWMKTATGPVRLLWAHIANESLAQTARTALRTEGRVGIRFFDTYHIAASKMVKTYFNREARQGVREATLIGFGKFGRDLMEMLIQDQSPDEQLKIRVVDIQNREKEVRGLAEDLNFQGDIRFTVANVHELDVEDKPDKAYFLCTDDDIGNLAAALMLTRRVRGTYIFVRMAKWPMPAIEDHLSEQSGITFININDLVVEGIMEMPGIFAPAREQDLKRTDRRRSEPSPSPAE